MRLARVWSRMRSLRCVFVVLIAAAADVAGDVYAQPAPSNPGKAAAGGVKTSGACQTKETCASAAAATGEQRKQLCKAIIAVRGQSGCGVECIACGTLAPCTGTSTWDKKTRKNPQAEFYYNLVGGKLGNNDPSTWIGKCETLPKNDKMVPVMYIAYKDASGKIKIALEQYQNEKTDKGVKNANYNIGISETFEAMVGTQKKTFYRTFISQERIFATKNEKGASVAAKVRGAKMVVCRKDAAQGNTVAKSTCATSVLSLGCSMATCGPQNKYLVCDQTYGCACPCKWPYDSRTVKMCGVGEKGVWEWPNDEHGDCKGNVLKYAGMTGS